MLPLRRAWQERLTGGIGRLRETAGRTPTIWDCGLRKSEICPRTSVSVSLRRVLRPVLEVLGQDFHVAFGHDVLGDLVGDFQGGHGLGNPLP